MEQERPEEPEEPKAPDIGNLMTTKQAAAFLKMLAYQLGELARIGSEGHMDKAVMTVTDVVSYLGRTKNAVYKLLAAKAIPHHHQGRGVYFLRREIDEWLSKLPGVTVDQAIRTVSDRANAVDTVNSPRPTTTSWRPDHDPANPIVLVRRPALPKQRHSIAPPKAPDH